MSILGHMTIASIPERRTPPSILRNRLRDAREWRGLEQADIAVHLGIGRSTVSNYERGITVPGKLVVNAWAVITDTEVEWIKTGVEQSNNTDPDNGSRLGDLNSGPSHYNVVPLFGNVETAVAA